MELEKVIRTRSCIVAAVAADKAFERLTQPIRIAGSIHGKNGLRSPVRIEATSNVEYDLDEFLDAATTMPSLPGLPSKNPSNQPDARRVTFGQRQIRRVHAGGTDIENRFEAVSGTIGHWVRQARIGNVSVDEARASVADYNVAMVVPPWSKERLAREFEALLARDRKNYAAEWKKSRSAEATQSDQTAPEHSEDAIAVRFVAQHGNDWRFVAAWNRWLKWTGTHWVPDDTQQVQDLVRSVCRQSCLDLKPAEARRIASARTINAVRGIASTDRSVAVGVDVWDSHPGILNTPGGTIDLETGEISAAKRDHYLTQITAASAGSVPAIWVDFLDQITGGDPALLAYLARVCGYCLTGETSEQAFFFFHGDGGNGKSVFIQTIAKALGSYAATAPLDTFTVNRNNAHPTDLAGLRGKRLVTITETEQGRSWAESRIKSITGGDPIRARFMHRDFFEFLPSFKLIVVGNHRPQLTSVGAAMRRRLQLVPFAITVPENERDKNLANKLENNLDGILAWILDGYHDWRSQGLSPPDSVIRASEDYFHDEDLVGQWIQEQCVTGANRSATSRSLFENWSRWAGAQGVERGSTKLFGEALRSRNFVPKHSRTGNLWHGLALRCRAGDQEE